MDAKCEAEVQGESVYRWYFEEINGLTVCKQSFVIFLPRTGQFYLSHTATVTIFKLVGNGKDLTVTSGGNDAHLWL
jgi:hypothetical protein